MPRLWQHEIFVIQERSSGCLIGSSRLPSFVPLLSKQLQPGKALFNVEDTAVVLQLHRCHNSKVRTVRSAATTRAPSIPPASNRMLTSFFPST